MKTNQKIVIIDDDKQILKLLETMLKQDFPKCEIHLFDSINDKLYDFLLYNEISLYIIDVELNDGNKKGDDFALEVVKHRDGAIFLFISGYDYSLDSFTSFRGKAIFDFIQKPVSGDELRSRVSVLLNVSKTYNDMENRVRSMRNAVWDMLNYAKMFIVILDSDMDIKLANWNLATTIGFKNEDEMIGKNWLDFIPEEEREMIKTYHSLLINSETLDNINREFFNCIETKSGEKINVKWFNTKVNNNYNWTFSSGIPRYDENFENTEESIRAYYRDIIEQDKTMIEALRDTILDWQGPTVKATGFCKD
jgi:PAS domain S-box-containing protein